MFKWLGWDDSYLEWEIERRTLPTLDTKGEVGQLLVV